jgi:iron complex outermembrane receptor protein
MALAPRRPCVLGCALPFALGAASRAGDPPTPEPDAAALPTIPLGEITITATRSERGVLEVPGHVTVIDRDAIERSGAKDVPDLLRREAGVFVTQLAPSPEGYVVELRGFNNGAGNGSGTLVLVDGRRVNEPDTGVVDWSFLPSLDRVERIEVTRGPASAVHGDNAMAGVIHVITRDARDGDRMVLRGRSGTFDSDGGSLWAGGSEGPVGASFFLEDWRADGYRERSALESQQGETGLEFDLAGRATLALRGGYTSQTRDRPGTLTSVQQDDDRRQARPDIDESFDDVRERFGEARLDLALAEDLRLRSLAFHRRRNDDGRIESLFGPFDFSQESDTNGWNTQLEVDHELAGRRLRATAGLDLLLEDSDAFGDASGFLSRTHGRRKLYGFFLQNEVALLDDLLLSAGVRRDRVRFRGEDRVSDTCERDATGMPVPGECKFKQDVWAPSVALTWRARDDVSAYASWQRGFRFPNVNEAFGVFGFQPGLDPQRSESWELGLKARTARATGNLALYTMNVKDEMIFDPDAPNAFFPFIVGSNVNFDRVRHRGVELSGSVRPLDLLELYGGYTFDDTEIRRDSLTGLEGSRIPITPRHRGTAGVRLFLPFGFEAGVNANYVGSRIVANDLRNDLEKLSKYASYDARLGWRFALGEHVELLVEGLAYNLTDREYTENGGLSIFDGSIGFYPSPERHYVASAQITVRR